MELEQMRPETGPMQFGDDWPGVFIRGDNAFGYALPLGQLLEALDKGEKPTNLDVMQLRALLGLLRSSIVSNGKAPEYTQMIKPWTEARKEDHDGEEGKEAQKGCGQSEGDTRPSPQDEGGL